MAKKIQLEIPEPCHENWGNMTPDDKGRFCQSCQKSVIDFTTMSDREIAQFFKKPSTGSVCGRFLNDQLDREFEVPRKRIPWLRYFFQIAIPAFLASNKAVAQGKVKVQEVITQPGAKSKPDPNPKELIMFDEKLVLGYVQPKFKNFPNVLEGRVINEKGEIIAGATISLQGANHITESGINGDFRIPLPKPVKTETLIVSHVGYLVSKVQINVSRKNVVVVLAREVIVVTAGMVVRKPSKKKTIPLIPQKIMDTAYKFFKVFPNPVSSGAELTIEWKQTAEGYYHLQLADLTGKLIHQREIWIDSDAKWLNLDVPAVSPGTYVLYVVNKKTGKNHSEKVIIQ